MNSHEVFTVTQMNWNGIKNGKLLSLCVESGFDVLLTIDKNVSVYAVRGIGGLKNEAQRNVKPDHLQTVPRYRTKLRNYF